MVTMSEILGEQSTACPSYLRDKNYVRTKRCAVLRSDWLVIDDNVQIFDLVYELIKHKNSLTYELGRVVGESEKQTFDVIFRIDLSQEIKLAKELGYPNLSQVHMVQVKENEQGQHIAKFMYRYFCNKLKIYLMGDSHQYFGARKLWTSLSHDNDIQVDIVDIRSCKVLFSNVKLNHGKEDREFDTRLWSYGSDKENIRSVLINI